MTNTAAKKITYDGKPVQVESAIRDSTGLVINTTYLKKTEASVTYVNGVSIHFDADTSVSGGPEFIDYPYVGTFELSRITSTTTAEVIFSESQVNSGQYAPICQTKDDHKVYIYARNNVTPNAGDVIVIPTITIGSGVALNCDVEVTQNSNNPVTSGGVYTAIDDAATAAISAATTAAHNELYDRVKTAVPTSAVFTDDHVTGVANHYSPTGTTSKDASGGTLTDITNSSSGTQVVTGVNIDAAGHVTGVKSVALKSTDTNTWPTYTSQLTNNSGFITSSASITGSSGSCTGNAATASYAPTNAWQWVWGWDNATGDFDFSVSVSDAKEIMVVACKTDENIGYASAVGWGNDVTLFIPTDDGTSTSYCITARVYGTTCKITNNWHSKIKAIYKRT